MFPDLLRFFCGLVWVQYHTWKQKSGEKWGRPGNTCEVDIGKERGGAVPNYKCVHSGCESEFLNIYMEYSAFRECLIPA